MYSFLHNSRIRYFRDPQGAVVSGSEIVLRADAYNISCAKLRLWENGSEKIIEGKKTAKGFEFRYTAPKETGLVWYYFILQTPSGTEYCGGRSGEGVISGQPDSWQITVYDGAFSPPAWFCEGIAYQIFPDRYHASENGGGLERLSYHTSLGRSAYPHLNWDDLPFYTPVDSRPYYLPCDFFGGDLKGITEKLPYIKELGVNCIYLNPVFESPSNHRYDTSDYKRIDPVLGGKEDMYALVSEAKKLGIRVMLDGVFSHTGSDSIYFNREGRYKTDGAYNSKESPYFDWYEFYRYPDDYRSWWGFNTLPEVNELTPSYIAFIKGVLEYWNEVGISSWRLDVADELPDEFIEQLREKLKQLDPDGLLLGEVWDDASNKTGFNKRRKYVDGSGLDSVMNYPQRDAIIDFFTNKTDAFILNNKLASLRENYPKPFYYATLNLLSSHDIARAISALGGAPEKGTLSREQQAQFCLGEEEYQTAKKRFIMASMLQFTLPGVPCVYYGDEAGVTGLEDPFNRKTYPWNNEDKEIRGAIVRLGSMRNGSDALKKGGVGFAAINGDCFAVIRRYGEEEIIMAVNRGARADISFGPDIFAEGADAGNFLMEGLYTDIMSGEEYLLEGALTLSLEALNGKILARNREA